MRSKYGAIRTTIDGITFASKAEARRYSELQILLKSGEITDLKLQPKYPLVFIPSKGRDSVNVGSYIADFWYRKRNKDAVTEDVKGMLTPVYRLKKKMVEAIYGITIVEVRR